MDEKPPSYEQNVGMPPPQQQGLPPAQGMPPPQGYPQGQQAYPPQPSYVPQTTTSANVTVVQANTVRVSWKEHPVANYKCQFCGNIITTQTRTKMGNATLLITLLLFLFIGVFALIFLCIPIFHDVEHVCPVDGNVVGVHKKFDF